jgi:hypothetical protein
VPRSRLRRLHRRATQTPRHTPTPVASRQLAHSRAITRGGVIPLHRQPELRPPAWQERERERERERETRVRERIKEPDIPHRWIAIRNSTRSRVSPRVIVVFLSPPRALNFFRHDSQPSSRPSKQPPPPVGSSWLLFSKLVSSLASRLIFSSVSYPRTQLQLAYIVTSGLSPLPR